MQPKDVFKNDAASVRRGWRGYRIGRNSLGVSILKKNNHAKKEDIVGERLKSHFARLSHMWRTFRRDIITVSKYSCLWKPP